MKYYILDLDEESIYEFEGKPIELIYSLPDDYEPRIIVSHEEFEHLLEIHELLLQGKFDEILHRYQTLRIEIVPRERDILDTLFEEDVIGDLKIWFKANEGLNEVTEKIRELKESTDVAFSIDDSKRIWKDFDFLCCVTSDKLCVIYNDFSTIWRYRKEKKLKVEDVIIYETTIEHFNSIGLFKFVDLLREKEKQFFL